MARRTISGRNSFFFGSLFVHLIYSFFISSEQNFCHQKKKKSAVEKCVFVWKIYHISCCCCCCYLGRHLVKYFNGTKINRWWEIKEWDRDRDIAEKNELKFFANFFFLHWPNIWWTILQAIYKVYFMLTNLFTFLQRKTITWPFDYAKRVRKKNFFFCSSFCFDFTFNFLFHSIQLKTHYFALDFFFHSLSLKQKTIVLFSSSKLLIFIRSTRTKMKKKMSKTKKKDKDWQLE